jgi:hypothetical protein
MKLNTHGSDSEFITNVTPAVKFFCKVRTKELSALLTGIVDHPLYFVYRIRFSDDYEDDFTILDNGFVEGDKKEASAPYAAAIKNDVHVLWGFQPDKEVYTMRWMIDGKHTNIWILEFDRDGDKVYFIYYNGDYRFEMKKSGAGWLSRTARKIDPEVINDKLAAEIGRMIDQELQQVS